MCVCVCMCAHVCVHMCDLGVLLFVWFLLGSPKFPGGHMSLCGGGPCQHPGLQLFAVAGSCEPDGVGEHRAKLCSVPGDTGGLKMPVRVRAYSNSHNTGGVWGRPRGGSRSGAHPLPSPGRGVMNPLQKQLRCPGSHSEEEISPSVDIRGVGTQSLSSQPRAPQHSPGAPSHFLVDRPLPQVLCCHCPGP